MWLGEVPAYEVLGDMSELAWVSLSGSGRWSSVLDWRGVVAWVELMLFYEGDRP